MDRETANRRIQTVVRHLAPNTPFGRQERNFTAKRNTEDPEPYVTVIDSRTGKKARVPIKYGDVLKAMQFKQLGLRLYDPGYKNTCMSKSAITYIDGEKGILRYRGYAIEELAEKSNFLEVAFLLIHGDLPDQRQMSDWTSKIMTHTYIHQNLTQLMKTFRYNSHPMGMLISSIAALGTFYPEANPALQGSHIFEDANVRNKQIYRIIGKLPTIAAAAYRHRIGRNYNEPVNYLSYTENFLYMMDRLQETNYRPNRRLAKALDVMFILHADHELNCSTSAMRHVTSTKADPYTGVSAAAGALYGPLHGGANEAVLRMLESIGSVKEVSKFIDDVKNKKKKLMGFGHRVYKNYDPRARIIRKIAYEVFDICGEEPLIEVAIELERQAVNDNYFKSRGLYPNVDFYSGLIYKAMGFPTDMFPVLFCIPRAVGWLAHWNEHLSTPENKITRPRQVYTGPPARGYPSISDRPKATGVNMNTYSSNIHKRRHVSVSEERLPHM